MNRPNPVPHDSGRAANEPGAAAPNAAWTQHKERSSLLMLRVMSWLSLRLGRRLSRPLVYAIAAYFVCFAPTARRGIGAVHDRPAVPDSVALPRATTRPAVWTSKSMWPRGLSVCRMLRRSPGLTGLNSLT